MAEKRKISVRKVLQAVVTLVVTVACIAAISGAGKAHDQRKIKGLDIKINNPQYQFVDEAEVENILLHSNHLDIRKDNIGKLDISHLEKVIDANPWVSDAEVYVDNRKVLHVQVAQRIPVVRLIEQNGNSYYLDKSLSTMPLSRKYIHYAAIVTNVPTLRADSASLALKGQIVSLVKYIEKDTFWNAQVSQIILTDDKTFELVPVLGKHRILLGDTAHMDVKFRNLFAFYKNVLNRIGWNKYEVLDLRFKGQIVASPTLPWKAPKEYALSNKTWAKQLISKGIQDTAKALPAAPQAPDKAAAPLAGTPAKADQKPVTKETRKIISATDRHIAPKPADGNTGKKQEKTKEPVKPKYVYPGNDNNQ